MALSSETPSAADVVPASLDRILRSRCFQYRGDDIHQVGRVSYPTFAALNAVWPMYHQWAGNAAFMAKVFVHIQRRTAEICPATSVRVMRSVLSHRSQRIAGVYGVETLARWTVEAKRSPFVARCHCRLRRQSMCCPIRCLPSGRAGWHLRRHRHAAPSLRTCAAASKIFATCGIERIPSGIG